jgi:hypothetical protein
MNPLTPYLLWIKIGAALVLIAALAGYHHHVFEQGVKQESARRDKIDAANSLRAKTELSALNAKLKAAQTELDTAIANVASLEKDMQHEKAISSDYQLRLASGAERLRVLTIQHHTDQARSADGAAIAAVDHDSEAVEDLAPAVGLSIEKLRSNENEAIDRLDACVIAYDAVKAASEQK